ncbi:MAG: D-glycero-beta-D-manno-heptose 1-phosphate adenylyltransferase [candidate division Zixibacteria bacterium]
MSDIIGKLAARKNIGKLCTRLRARRQKIVFTNGVFDILHIGHVRYLRKAKALGDVLIIGLNTDKSVKKFKGSGRPLNRQSDRAGVLSALECVDYIVYFSEPTPLKLIQLIRPDFLVKGADYKIKDIVGADFVKSSGGKVIRIKLSVGRSTTNLIKKIKSL